LTKQAVRVATQYRPSPAPVARRRADATWQYFPHAEYVHPLTAAAALRVIAALSKAAWWPWSFDLESGVRAACDVGYLCANFGIPRPLCSRLRPDVRDRQTSNRRQMSNRQTSDKSIA